MKYFKDQNNAVYAYEADGSQDEHIKPWLNPISEEAAMELTSQLPTPADIEAVKVATVQLYMDDAARAYRYDDIKTACTYADEPTVPKFQAEGQAFRAWRSLVWAACYAILADVQAGTREIPTDEQLISELPQLGLY